MEDNRKADFIRHPFIIFHYKLKRVKKVLATWTKVAFGDIFRRVVNLEEWVCIKDAQLEVYPTPKSREELNRANAELRKFYLYGGEFWKQKVGMKLFGKGDRNTKFFRSYLNRRRKKLNISEIQMEQGDTITLRENICAEAVSFYEKQFVEDFQDRL